MAMRAQWNAGDQSDDGASFAGGQMVRGSVTAVAADHLTVKTEMGEVYRIVVSANTRLTRARQPVKLADVKVGDGIGAMGVLDASTKTVHAILIGVLDVEQVKKAREELGKVYIAGKVTAIDRNALKLTVMRPDNISQVIGVDEGTSFKRGGRGMSAMVNGSGDVGSAQSGDSGGESITLAEVTVGDSVVGRGALKNGLFVPAEVRVMDAAGQGRRRRVEGDGAAPAGQAGAGTPASPAGTPKI
jgi:hypothetical protein